MLDQCDCCILDQSNVVTFLKQTFQTEILKGSIKIFLIPEMEEEKFNESRLISNPHSSILGAEIHFSTNLFANW